MITYTDVEKFLQAVFGSDFGTRAIFANLNPPAHVRDFRQLDPNRDCYWSIAAYPPDYTGTNTADAALEVRALVIDDVGTKGPSEGAVLLALGEPTAITLTSAGNFQWAYRLSKPVAIDDWGGFFGGVEALIAHALEARAAQTLMRLPMGKNTKPQNAGFAVRLVRINSGVMLDPDTIARVRPSGPKRAPAAGGGADVKLGLDDLRTAMSWIVNDAKFDERNADWLNVIGHGLKALCKDDEDGFTVYDEWSQPHPKHDTALIRKAWNSFGARGLTSKGGKLKALWQAANPEGFRKMFAPLVFDDGEEAPEVPPGPGRVKFIRNAKKQIMPMVENAKRAIVGLGIGCTYDDFHRRAFAARGRKPPEKVTDHMLLLLRDEITAVYGKEFGSQGMFDAVMTLALQNRFNPVADMLAAAERDWDGVARLDRLGADYFHTEDTALARECFRKVMIAAARRARQPGCKFDQILVLESPEGWDKSTAWAVLAGEGNFSDASIIGKDARAVQEELADIWIHENAELSGLGKADIEHVKAFASKVNDRARAAYGRVLTDQPRQSIEVGTTNAEAYLMSTTGNRRFWGFKLLDRVDIARLRVDRLQLWGEAAQYETKGETLVLDEALWDDAAAAQEKRRIIDPWEDELSNLSDNVIKVLGAFETVSSVAIHDFLGGHRGQPITSGAGRKICEIMKRLGWERCELKDALGKRLRGYRRLLSSAVCGASAQENLF